MHWVHSGSWMALWWIVTLLLTRVSSHLKGWELQPKSRTLSHLIQRQISNFKLSDTSIWQLLATPLVPLPRWTLLPSLHPYKTTLHTATWVTTLKAKSGHSNPQLKPCHDCQSHLMWSQVPATCQLPLHLAGLPPPTCTALAALTSSPLSHIIGASSPLRAPLRCSHCLE